MHTGGLQQLTHVKPAVLVMLAHWQCILLPLPRQLIAQDHVMGGEIITGEVIGIKVFIWAKKAGAFTARGNPQFLLG